MAESKQEYLTPDDIRKKIAECATAMKTAAKELRFEDAAHYRDQLRHYEQLEVDLG